ncbi:hypothetical protein VOLCADRAFT_90773 [Volvox carteri f. nagariensis]|uniref:AB hydrolase-1 domain-containing protein n=1 Tax=Volvox carteri f. nagariensis TaxID=3068 RepID=D8TVP9_VOLCA|nr:uncharacterized protein VOLCADRAFT_90773 [Volvox carteri f. nagariensis]EFJ48493.1 hypothetical protein VOLCADRAFT_90773 [Volvox carteri f. nagariensis]|eukprot:XP_002950292.1 hypothetical protein VOLCADRAFT_90773 [Volvox carteri f. nagariensis]
MVMERAASAPAPAMAAAAAAAAEDEPSAPPPPPPLLPFPSMRPFGDGFTATTVLQTAPADPRESRAALPVYYDRRAWQLLLRLVAAVIAFAAVGMWAALQIVVMVGAMRLLVVLAASEAAFLMYYRRKYKLLNAQPLSHAPERHDGLAAFNRLLQVCRFFQHKIDARAYLSTWFCGADYRLIRRDNVADLIAYGFWYMSRPLLFYGFTECMALLTKTLLLALGCDIHIDPVTGLMVATAGLDEHLWSHQGGARRRRCSGGSSSGGSSFSGSAVAAEAASVSDNFKNAGKSGSTRCTMLDDRSAVLAGWDTKSCLLAAGLPLVAVEYKHVSMRWCSIIPSADDIAAGVVGLLDRLGLEQACVVAHSYGTFVASRLAQLYAHRMQSMALLDPVCFGMFMPHLLANFIYREPRTTTINTWFKDVLFNFVSRDLHCAAALCRRFYWSDVNLWPQDIPGRTLVAIAGHDQLIHVDEVLDHIQHYAAKILYHPNHTHAELLMDLNWQQQVLADIVAMASSGGGIAGAREVQRRLTTMPAAALAAEASTDAPPPMSLGEALATTGPGVVRRVTTHRQVNIAAPPQVVQTQQVALPYGAAAAAATAVEEGGKEEGHDDVAALAAALSEQIGQARERQQQNGTGTAMVNPPSPPLLMPTPSDTAQGASASAVAAVEGRSGAGSPPPPPPHAVVSPNLGAAGASTSSNVALPQPSAPSSTPTSSWSAAANSAARSYVPRRCTAAARLQHGSGGPSHEEVLLLELASAGLNRAVLIASPTAAAAVPPPPLPPSLRGAVTAAAGGGGGAAAASLSGCLRRLLPAISEVREEASGPSSPVRLVPPVPSAFAAATAEVPSYFPTRMPRGATVIRPRRTMTS